MGLQCVQLRVNRYLACQIFINGYAKRSETARFYGIIGFIGSQLNDRQLYQIEYLDFRQVATFDYWRKLDIFASASGRGCG